MARPGRTRSRKLLRPPFENRWTDGATGWQWYVELKRLGPSYVRTRLAQQEALSGFADVEPLCAPLGFVRDWLDYLDRRDREIQRRWRVAILIVATVAAVAGVIAALPVVRTWF